MHQADLNGGEVVTFNGAGVGKINGQNVDAQSTKDEVTDLKKMINEFDNYRTNTGGMTRDLMVTVKGAELYDEIKGTLQGLLNSSGDPLRGDLTEADVKALEEKCWTDVGMTQGDETRDRQLLAEALKRIQGIVAENDRVRALSSGLGGENAKPALVHDGQIDAISLDYQLAVLKTSDDKKTTSVNTSPTEIDALKTIFGKRIDLNTLSSNQTDIVGTETTATPMGMVSNSQVHYGELLKLFVEDQPDYRGNALTDAAWESGGAGDDTLNGGVPESPVNWRSSGSPFGEPMFTRLGRHDHYGSPFHAPSGTTLFTRFQPNPSNDAFWRKTA